MKKILIIFSLFIVLIIPVATIFAPVLMIGNIFTNAWGNLKDFLGYDDNTEVYDGNLTEDLDMYLSENKISLNYKQIFACVMSDMDTDPTICYTNHDEEGNITTRFAQSKQDYLTLDWEEWNGPIDESYFKDIHVLGKYSVSKWEQVGSHMETRTKDNSHYDNIKQTWVYEVDTYEVEVPDYDWVYYPEILRGKCEDSDEQMCHIKLEDKYVYPFQFPTFSLTGRYGIQVDMENFTFNTANYQVWNGNILYAFSKATIEEMDSGHILLKIDANGIDMYVEYRAVEEGTIYSDEFKVGDIVEATEEFARTESETQIFVYNSAKQYINPYLFLDINNISFAGLGEGSIIYGYEDFTPDFTNLDAWINKNGYYKSGYCGQCTWFAWGMFYQHYGYSPGFTGEGTLCAQQASNHLNGWKYSKSPSPGAIFSQMNHNHVGIVCGVEEDNTIIIIEGNLNYKNDTFVEFQTLPDWQMRRVPFSSWHDKWVFCNPPA